MRKLVKLDLPADAANWRPEPFPGALDAIEAGCTCPVLQPHPGALVLAADCPVHELQRVAS